MPGITRNTEPCTTCGRPADDGYRNIAAGEACADAVHATYVVQHRTGYPHAASSGETGWIIAGPLGGVMAGPFDSFEHTLRVVADATLLDEQAVAAASIELAKLTPAKVRNGYVRIADAELVDVLAGDVALVEPWAECEGHPAGPFDPMGETVYCDGSCQVHA